MCNFLKKLPHQNHDVILQQEQTRLTFAEVKAYTQVLAQRFILMKGEGVAVSLDNSIAWLVVDFALLQANKVSIPVPHFFTTAQIEHTLEQSKANWLVSDTKLKNRAEFAVLDVHGQAIYLYQIERENTAQYFPKTQKITYTSGSTGAPKGVCLSYENQLVVASSLCEVIGLQRPKHLCLLPLSVLLENIAGVYAPLLSGGMVEVVGLESLGFSGSQLLYPHKLLQKISAAQPNSLILVPELLRCLISAAQQGWQPPSSLRFIAVGGAKVDPELLQQAKQLGLPVFQGYGLSESGSVVALNIGEQDGSVGKLLPHLQARIVAGELQIKGNNFLGYLGGDAMERNSWLKTGDRVSQQGQHFIVEGRLKNVLINSFGRNISPEWPESVLLAYVPLLQCVVVGDGKPFLTALIYTPPELKAAVIDNAIELANQQLPDYAQIKAYVRVIEAFSVNNGMLTANGRPKREAILTNFAQQISMLYTQNHNEVAVLEPAPSI
ncbi:AMP-binding protein [Pseudoalteromonas piscicida]|uniref:Long-chain fatty acid--CoA ligase n=1 Tax=Pseudoalteromonas piscicida TaxID=43662 RepID=A0A2A5JU81_PSEO7|nr:AMP-binding protein [Pseudoalteromonas piscicida]PCK32899.1 long-chain fatty acid--CoA ligase [Pseudoalteromonas piscicida]